jgi:hypothetical protein
MANYRVLEKEEVKNGEGFEIRKYPPHKRTINVCGRTYFVPIPYVVFGCFRHHVGGGSPLARQLSYLAMAFAKEEDEFVYFPTLPNVSPSYLVCLGGVFYAENHQSSWGSHYAHANVTCEELISRLWQSPFADIHYWGNCERALEQTYGGFRAWQGLDLTTTVSKLHYGEIKLVDFISRAVAGLTSYQR